MNSTQLQTTLAPIIAAVAGAFAAKGLLGIDAVGWTTILSSLIAAGAIAFPAIITRAKALKDTVGHMPSTTVVTDKATADALPDNPDVIAATPAIVAAIKQSGDASTTGASVR
jgi:hypothetical protein